MGTCVQEYRRLPSSGPYQGRTDAGARSAPDMGQRALRTVPAPSGGRACAGLPTSPTGCSRGVPRVATPPGPRPPRAVTDSVVGTGAQRHPVGRALAPVPAPGRRRGPAGRGRCRTPRPRRQWCSLDKQRPSAVGESLAEPVLPQRPAPVHPLLDMTRLTSLPISAGPPGAGRAVLRMCHRRSKSGSSTQERRRQVEGLLVRSFPAAAGDRPLSRPLDGADEVVVRRGPARRRQRTSRSPASLLLSSLAPRPGMPVASGVRRSMASPWRRQVCVRRGEGPTTSSLERGTSCVVCLATPRLAD